MIIAGAGRGWRYHWGRPIPKDDRHSQVSGASMRHLGLPRQYSNSADGGVNMEAQLEHPAEEIKRLRRCIDDLVSIVALPAVRGGGEPAEIVRALIEVLLGMLSLDLIYVRLGVAVSEAPVEVVRFAQPGSLAAGPREIGELFDRRLGDDPQQWPPPARHNVGDGNMTLVPLRLGPRGEIGVIVAGSRRADFPRQTESLVLSVAANQAAVGLQQALLLSEQNLRTIEELRAQQSMLSESEQRFRAIFDEAGTGITLVDLQQPGTPIRNNRALQTMLGLSQEELGFFETYDELTARDDREADAATFRELCEGKRDSLRQEKHFILRDGSSVWANVIFTLLRDSAGRPRFIIAIHEDITERKRAVERLQAKQELLDLAQKSARAMAFDWYVQQEVNVWSPEQEALHGLQPGSFDGTYRSWKNTIYAPDWPVVLKAIKHAQETGVVAAEWRVIWPDGSLHWLATNGQMFFDEQGRPFRMVGFTSEVTRRKLAEEDLRRSEAFLAEAQHLSSTGSFSWRVGTEEITWSEQAYYIFELDPAVPMTPELMRTRVHPEDIPSFDEVFDRARAGGGDFEFEHRLLMSDHSLKYLHVIAHGTRGQDGELEYIGAVQDVTERRLSEEALNNLRSELAHVSRVATLGALTASIAHEVNQPLSGIITNASTCLRMLAADPPNVEGARETARRTIRDGHRASDVITRLRALFGKKGATSEPVDLNEATREVIAMSLSELRRNRVIPRLELADDLPPVTGDRVQLQQVILNLLFNALDAMSGVEDCPTPLVIRTARDEDDRVRLSVQDAGVGFDPQAAARLFEAFYTTKNDGMGIGLSVSRSIIESHHGRLWATLNDGPGATFSFSIPHASEAVTDASGVGAIPTPAVTDAERVGGDS
jgi:PAS domain S-box-containing protein